MSKPHVFFAPLRRLSQKFNAGLTVITIAALLVPANPAQAGFTPPALPNAQSFVHKRVESRLRQIVASPQTDEPTETPLPTETATPLTATETPTPEPIKGLVFTFSPSSSTIIPDDTVTFTVSLKNTSDVAFSNIVFSNVLPADYTPAVASFGEIQFDASSRALAWSLAVLQPGQEVSQTYSVTIGAPTGTVGSVYEVDSAMITADQLADPIKAETAVLVTSDQELNSVDAGGGQAVGLDGNVRIDVPPNAVDSPQAIVILDASNEYPASGGQPWTVFQVQLFADTNNPVAPEVNNQVVGELDPSFVTETPGATAEATETVVPTTITETTTETITPAPTDTPVPTDITPTDTQVSASTTPVPTETTTSEVPEPSATPEATDVVNPIQGFNNADNGPTETLEPTATLTDAPTVAVTATIAATETQDNSAQPAETATPESTDIAPTETLTEVPAEAVPLAGETDTQLSLAPIEAHFDKPVELTVSLDGITDLATLDGSQKPFLVTLDEASGSWVNIPIDSINRQANTITAAISHFSTWGAGVGPSFPQNGANVLLFDSANPDLHTGHSHFSIPIWTPPGRNGLAPSLALSYSSGTADGALGDIQAPWVGMGWSIGSVEIARQNTDGVCASSCGGGTSYGYQNNFLLLFNGIGSPLVADSTTPGRYHTKDESFLYIQLHNDNLPPASTSNTTGEWWEVVEKNGTRWRLGWDDTSAHSEQTANMLGYPGAATGAWAALGYAGHATNVVALRWRADQAVDVYGNTMTFSYTEETRAISGASTGNPAYDNYDKASYLAQINYTSITGSPLPYVYDVAFVLETRPSENTTSTNHNWDNWDDKRLKEIDVQYTAPGTSTTVTERSYSLGYTVHTSAVDDGKTWDTTELTSVTEGGVAGSGLTAPTTIFTYADYDNRANCGSGCQEWAYPRLTSIQNGWGGTATYTYQSMVRSNPDWYYWPVQQVDIQTMASGGQTLRTTFSYTNPCYNDSVGGWCNPGHSGELIGYEWTLVTTKDLDGTTTLAKTLHRFSLNQQKEGREIDTQAQDASGTILSETTTDYMVVTAGLPGYFTYPSTVETFTRQDGALKRLTHVENVYDSTTGNLSITKEFDGTPATPVLYRQTSYDYFINTHPSQWLLNSVWRKQVTDAYGSILSEHQFVYDSNTPPTITPALNNVAPAATATASSQHSSSFVPANATDGIIGQNGTGEWKSSSSDAHPWIMLTWSSGQTIDRIRLFDLVNTTDWANSGTLTFSDSSTLTIPANSIPNNGTQYEITFPAKTGITSVKFTPTGSGSHIGLSEFQVFAPSTLTKGELRLSRVLEYSPAPIMPSGQVAYWQFTEGTGSTAGDSSGNGNTATLSSASWSTGKLGNGLSLNGSSTKGDAGDTSSLSITGTGLTLEAWIKLNSTSGTQAIIDKPNQYSLRVVNGQLKFYDSISWSSGVGPYGTISANTWTHVAVTFNGSQAVFYINGSQVGSASHSGSLTDTSNHLYLGCHNGTTNFLNGKLDEAAVYNRALSSTEILARYNAGTPQNIVNIIDTTTDYDSTHGVPTISRIYLSRGDLDSAPPDPSPNSTTHIDPNYRTTTFTYDTTMTFVRSTETTAPPNVATETTWTTYDYGLGLPLTKTDANGAVTTTAYDGLGRLIGITYDGYTQPNVKYFYPDLVSGSITAPFAVEMQVWDETANVYRLARTIYDGLGRTLQVQGPAETSGDLILTDTAYDARSLTFYTGQPRQLSKTDSSGVALSNTVGIYPDNDPHIYVPTWGSLPHSTNAYDALGRLLTTTFADSTVTTTSYNGLRTTFKDQNNHQKIQEIDAFGRLVKVEEYTGSSTYTLYATTTYQYDSRNLLTRVTDAAGNITTITYDGAGRKIGMTDPDMGSWSYGYDFLGNLTSQTDAKSQLLSFEYDKLGRMVKKWQGTVSSGTLLATYTYDETTGDNKGIGRRTSITDPSGSTAWVYNALGQVTSTTYTISGAPASFYSICATYDAFGRVRAQKYPDSSGACSGSSETLTYGYNAMGTLETLSGTNNYVTDVDYSASGQVKASYLGNGVTSQACYQANNLRLTELRAYSGSFTSCGSTVSSPLLDVQYSQYDNAGNVKQVIQTTSSLAETLNYTYDDLDRLTGVSGAYSQSFAENTIGNLTSKAGVTLNYIAQSGSCPDGALSKPHAVSSAGSDAYCYDLNGNMVKRTEGGVTYTQTFDAENRLTTVVLSTGGATTDFKYDGDGHLVAKLIGNVKTYYVGGVYEIETTTTGGTTSITKKTSYYPVAGAMRVEDLVNSSNSGVFYILKDQLGSASVVLNSSGTINTNGEQRYYPFGESRVATAALPTDKLFTGQQQMAGIGLYNYGARFYDPKIGRFISVDTIAPDNKDPQTLNRYAYVTNNPLKYVDPTGHQEQCSGTDAFISETTGDGGISQASCWAQQRDAGIGESMGFSAETAKAAAALADAAGLGLSGALKVLAAVNKSSTTTTYTAQDVINYLVTNSPTGKLIMDVISQTQWGSINIDFWNTMGGQNLWQNYVTIADPNYSNWGLAVAAIFLAHEAVHVLQRYGAIWGMNAPLADSVEAERDAYIIQYTVEHELTGADTSMAITEFTSNYTSAYKAVARHMGPKVAWLNNDPNWCPCGWQNGLSWIGLGGAIPAVQFASNMNPLLIVR